MLRDLKKIEMIWLSQSCGIDWRASGRLLSYYRPREFRSLLPFADDLVAGNDYDFIIGWGISAQADRECTEPFPQSHFTEPGTVRAGSKDSTGWTSTFRLGWRR